MCRCLVKSILFSVNLICTLLGLGVIGLGTFVVLVTEETIIGPSIKVGGYAFITIGALVFLISFSGCCGTITESKCMLITYAVLMALFAALKIAFVVWLSIKKDDIRNAIVSQTNAAFTDPDLSNIFHVTENVLKCCGTYGPDSYDNPANLTAPTCCDNPTSTTQCNKTEAYQIGCTTMIESYFEEYLRILGITLIAFISIELAAMFCAIYIIRTIKSMDGKIISRNPGTMQYS